MTRSGNTGIVSRVRLLPRYFFLAVMLCMEYVHAGEQPADHVEFFAATYGLADREANPPVDRAYRIFERVRMAADIGGRRTPRLVVVNSRADPWAQALRDGHVVLSRGAVEICYRDVDRELGDARLAFVLGHELAHLAKDDFWHSEVYRALAGTPGGESVRRLLAGASDADPDRQEEIRLKEAEADDLGFIYAAVAGYPVDSLPGNHGEQDFFSYWLAQTHTRPDPTHPAPADRATVLRSRLQAVIGAIEYYRFGVRLLHYGRLDAARYFLETFQETFPSREVFGNLGYLYLQKAMATMPADLAYEFWMPALFDVASRADRLANTGTRGGEMPAEASGYLEQAVEYLNLATKRDAEYAPAWINLAIAQFFLGNRHLALHAVEQALRLQPENYELVVLRTVLITRAGQGADMTPESLQGLETMAAEPGVSPSVHYNLARLYQLQGRIEAAEKHRAWLRDHTQHLPAAYYSQICTGKDTTASGCKTPEPRLVDPLWPLPVPPGADLYENKELKARLHGDAWQQEAFDFQRTSMHGHIFWQPGRTALLELDGYIEIVALYGQDLGTAAELQSRAGSPVIVRQLASGELWVYPGGWAVLVQDKKVQEAWVERQPG